MIDNEKVTSRINLILNNLNELKKFKKLSQEKFIRSIKNTSAAKYLLQTSIEAMIDISNHIIAREKLGIPENNLHAFEILAENDIISKDNLTTYREMVKFRNLIVHLYQKVDNKRVYEIIKYYLDDFNKFIMEITKFCHRI